MSYDQKKYVPDAAFEDEETYAHKVSGEMAAIGGIVLKSYVEELGPNGLLVVSQRVFSAMYGVLIRQEQKERERAELLAKARE